MSTQGDLHQNKEELDNPVHGVRVGVSLLGRDNPLSSTIDHAVDENLSKAQNLVKGSLYETQSQSSFVPSSQDYPDFKFEIKTQTDNLVRASTNISNSAHPENMRYIMVN